MPGLDLTKQVCLLFIQYQQRIRIQTNTTVGERYSDTSLYEVSEYSLAISIVGTITNLVVFKKAFLFKNGPIPASFSFIFGPFKQTIQFLQQINVKKCLVYPESCAGIRTHNLWNASLFPKPLDQGSRPKKSEFIFGNFVTIDILEKAKYDNKHL